VALKVDSNGTQFRDILAGEILANPNFSQAKQMENAIEIAKGKNLVGQEGVPGGSSVIIWEHHGIGSSSWTVEEFVNIVLADIRNGVYRGIQAQIASQ
jgi:hypothetical protein